MTGLTYLIDELRKYIHDPNKGLPEEIFLFVSELTPLINVDLLVRDDEGRVLLAWRNDQWYGSGWHVPGGIIRVKESVDERIQRCAEAELHSRVIYRENPLEIHSIIEPSFRERAHFFSFIYDCHMPDCYIIENGTLGNHETGFLAWHEIFPNDMLRCHDFYKKYFKQ